MLVTLQLVELVHAALGYEAGVWEPQWPWVQAALGQEAWKHVESSVQQDAAGVGAGCVGAGGVRTVFGLVPAEFVVQVASALVESMQRSLEPVPSKNAVSADLAPVLWKNPIPKKSKPEENTTTGGAGAGVVLMQDETVACVGGSAGVGGGAEAPVEGGVVQVESALAAFLVQEVGSTVLSWCKKRC